MSLERNISHLKKLKMIQPNRDWENKTKHELLSEISSQNRLMKAYELTTAEKLDLAFSSFMRRLVPSVSKIVAVFLIVLMGSGVSLAAQASVPGQALWPIKRSIEKAELTLAFSSVKETEIHIKHVSTRLDEIEKILSDTNNEPAQKEKKEKAIKQAVTHLEKDITAADSSLKVVKEEKKKPLEVVALAKKVKDAAKEASNNIEEQKKQIVEGESASIDEALNNAKALNDQVGDSAVKVAIAVHDEVLAASQPIEQGPINNNGTTTDSGDEFIDNTAYETSTPATTNVASDDNKDEVAAVKEIVKEMINSDLDETSVEVETVKQKAVQVEGSDLQVIKNSISQEASQDLDNINQIEQKSDEAAKTLAEAKALIEDGFLWDGYQKMYQVRKDYEKTEYILEEIVQAIADHQTIDQDVIDQLNEMSPDKDSNTNTEGHAVESSTLPLKEEGLVTEPEITPAN